MGVTIPLPELDVTKPAPAPPPDALSEFQRAAQLQTAAAQAQEIQARTAGQNTQNQMQALQLKDEQLRRQLAPQFVQKDASGKPVGFDNEGLYNAMMAGGADPMSITGMRMKQLELQKSLIGLSDAALAHQDKVNGELYNSLESIRDINKKTQPAQPSATPAATPSATSAPAAPAASGAPSAANQPAATPIGAAQPGSPQSMGGSAPGETPTASESAIQQAASAPKPISNEAQQAYQKELIRLHSIGIPIDKMKPFLTSESDLDQAEAELGLHKQALADASDVAKTQEAAGKGAESQAAALKANVIPFPEMGGVYHVDTGQFQQVNGGMTSPAMLESKYVMDQATKARTGKSPDPQFDAGYEKFKTMVPQFNLNIANQTGAGTGATPADIAKKFGMSQESFDQTAEKYYTSGQLPPIGRSPNAIAMNRALMNRAAELHPGASLAENSAEFKANQQSLSKLQTNFDQVSAFENTAGKNLDLFLQTAKPVLDSGSPWINKPLRSIDAGALGSGDLAAFNAARQTAVTEIAKVLNSSNASGVLSDSARHEVEGLIGPNATLRQIASASSVLRQDMANRHQAYQDQINDIHGRMKTQPNATPATTPNAPTDFFSQFGGKARQPAQNP